MLDVAIKHEERLRQLFHDTWYNKHYMFWDAGGGYQDFVAKKDTYNTHEFVSLDGYGNVLGYIAYDFDQNTRNVSGISAINFSGNKLTFGLDLYQAMTDIFEKYGFLKIDFAVVQGNPIEASYDRLVKRFGGRIVGIYYKHCKLLDGKYYNYKLYEIANPKITYV